MRWVVFPWSQINEPTNKPFLKSGENPTRAGTHSGVHFSGGPKSAYPGSQDPKLCFRTPVPLSRVGPLVCHARVPERDAECSEDKVSLAPDLARVSHSLPDPAPVARTSHRLQPAWVRSLPGLGPARDCSLNPHLAQARSGDSSWKPGLSPLPDGPRPASGTPSQQTASDLGAPRSFLCSGHRGPPEPRVIVGPTLHTHHTPHAALAGVPRAGTLWNRPKREHRGRSHRDLGTPRHGDAAITVQTAPRPPGRPAPLSGGRRSARRRRRPLTGHPTPEPSPETRARGGAKAGPQVSGPILRARSLPDSGRSQWAGTRVSSRATPGSTSSTVHNGPRGRPARPRPTWRTRRGMGSRVAWNKSGARKGTGKKWQGAGELTNEGGAGGRERPERESKPTGAKRRDFLPHSPS